MTLKERIAEFTEKWAREPSDNKYMADDLTNFITTLLAEQKEEVMKQIFSSNLYFTTEVTKNPRDGEWCTACGAWKTYGVADTHHCTGYKITC